MSAWYKNILCQKCKWLYIDGVSGDNFCCNIDSMYFKEGWSIDSFEIKGCNVFYEGEPFDYNKSLDEDSEEVHNQKCKMLDEATEYYFKKYY